MPMRVTCMCCGARYNDNRDCPNLEKTPHSTKLAVDIAQALLRQQIYDPTPEQIRVERVKLKARFE